MPGRQAIRSEETRRAILAAAGELFAQRGFDAVTMREIAKAASCSHTTIYIYFKDKEALLNQLAAEPLHTLRESMEASLSDPALNADDRLRHMTRVFLRFCLAHRNMYDTLFMARGSRVDEADPRLEVQRIRNQLFSLLQRALQESLRLPAQDERALASARIFFFMLHGILGTYGASPEPLDELMGRLSPTFELAVDALLLGLKQTVAQA